MIYDKLKDEEIYDYINELIKPPLRPEWDFSLKLDKKTVRVLNQLIKRYKAEKSINKNWEILFNRDEDYIIDLNNKICSLEFELQAEKQKNEELYKHINL